MYTLHLAANNFLTLLFKPKYYKMRKIFTVLEARGSCFHCAGYEGCGYQTDWAQLPPVVRSSRAWEGQYLEQLSDHLERKVKPVCENYDGNNECSKYAPI